MQLFDFHTSQRSLIGTKGLSRLPDLLPIFGWIAGLRTLNKTPQAPGAHFAVRGLNENRLAQLRRYQLRQPILRGKGRRGMQPIKNHTSLPHQQVDVPIHGRIHTLQHIAICRFFLITEQKRLVNVTVTQELKSGRI